MSGRAGIRGVLARRARAGGSKAAAKAAAAAALLAALARDDPESQKLRGDG